LNHKKGLGSLARHPGVGRDSVINFEWDVQKADLNKQKHAVSFEEAKTVFYDEFATLF
jgi:hypothetical protein